MSRAPWRSELAAALAPIARAEPLAGGDVNDAWRVELGDGRRVFVKTHVAPPPGIYAAEADGLAWLAEGPLRVPRVLAIGDSFLALEWLDLGGRSRDGRPGASFDEQFGRGLAQLHALGAPALGHSCDNYLATLPQDNAPIDKAPVDTAPVDTAPVDDVASFWIERRLRPAIARLGDRALLARLDQLAGRLAARPEWLGPPERPARLHGDLWWGNVGSAGGGAPVIFDPAVYGGPREIDLAMLALFGGIGDGLVGAYHEVWPLADDWRTRIGLWQLYPLAVHAVLFGGGYVSQLARGLDAAAS